MSNPVASPDEPGHVSTAVAHHQADQHQHQQHRPDPFAHLSALFLERGDAIIYSIVGICFFLAGFFALGYSFWNFGDTMLRISQLAAQTHTTLQQVVAGAIINLVSDLLLVLIIMEVLGTVIHYLKSHATSLRPFLFIGIISATRGILSIGARLSVETVNAEEFFHSMIELGVNALAILALGITLKLLGRMVDDH